MIVKKILLSFFAVCQIAQQSSCFSTSVSRKRVRTSTDLSSSTASGTTWFSPTSTDSGEENDLSIEQLKAQILQMGAVLDRGQAYNPTSGEYYYEKMELARSKILKLLEKAGGEKVPVDLKEIEGEWELVFTTVKHGVFRSSPFFLAIQEAYTYAEEQEINGENKANLFFRLHELQTCSWGVSKVGRVAQHISSKQNMLYSEFDTSIFSLTVIPILGWFKLLPTFGGCVITAASVEMGEEGKLEMKVDYTTSRPVPGLKGLGEWIWSIKVPVGFIWKLFPWNKGRDASCSVIVKYVDEDFRIVQDIDGELFVYVRPICPRSLDLMED